MKCATHPNIETNLRCGKCGKPICPKCMVQTPVGARCRDCAKLHKLPTFNVSPKFYLRAISTALGMAIVCGVTWWVVGSILLRYLYYIPFVFNLIMAVVIGYAIGEVISRSVNRKRGTGLAVVAGTAMVLCYLVNILAPGGVFSALDLVAVAVGVFFAVNRLR